VISFNTTDGAVQVPIHADVTLATPAVVAIRPIARGEVITAAHIELQTIGLAPRAGDRRAPVGDVEQLIGLEARQAIQMGDIVFSDQVQAPLLVKRGDIITVTSQGGGIRVSTTARARQDGARGELVQVETLETRERFDVRVVGTREAAVFAVTPPARPLQNERTETALRRQFE
jgi:flagella basal body P-ring formation protein FlgA